MAELLNMLFGNTSLQPGIKLMSFDLPEAMYDNYPGPRFGRTGLRDLCGVPRGPILMSAIKPLGRSPKELGQMVYDLAMGGCPIIKDDHSLMNQDYAPFEERVLQCVMALADAKEKTGKRACTLPTAPPTASSSWTGPTRQRKSVPTASWQHLPLPASP